VLGAIAALVDRAARIGERRVVGEEAALSVKRR